MLGNNGYIGRSPQAIRDEQFGRQVYQPTGIQTSFEFCLRL